VEINQILIYLLNLLDSYMKGNLHSACLLFLVFLFFTAGFVGMVSAKVSQTSMEIESPSGTPLVIESPSGYDNKNYTFTVNCSFSLADNNTTLIYHNISPRNSDSFKIVNWNVPKSFANQTKMVFYWDFSDNADDNDTFFLNNTSHLDNGSESCGTNYSKWKCTHKWNKAGCHEVCVEIYENKTRIGSGNDTIIGYSEVMPIEIKNISCPKPQNVFMWDEINGFDGNRSVHLYNHSFSNLTNSSGKNSENRAYCGYVKSYYAFSANFSEKNQSVGNEKKIKAIFYWDDKSSDSAIREPIDPNISHNYSHEWDKTGNKNVGVIGDLRDPYDESNDMKSNFSNVSILIIKDPKNFVSFPNPVTDIPIIGFFISLIISLIEPFSNLQNLGIFLITAGLVILFFAFTKNTVPVKISLFRLKTFYLKSVDSFTGIFTFVTGMYLYFVFGRCPWDIPIISSLPWLPNAYFSMLYCEYQTNSLLTNNKDVIPYLSILLGLVDVFASSMIIYGIGIPFLKGESKSGKFFREILRGERFFLPRSSTQQFSVQLKGLFILLKEKVKRISLTDQRGDRFPGKSGKKEEILISPKT
jgi:hypothetical protein